MKNQLYQKALQAQVFYEQLKEELGVNPRTHVVFHVDSRRSRLLKAACKIQNRYPSRCRYLICRQRKLALKQTMGEEALPLTAVQAALYALTAAMIQEIGCRRSPLFPEETVYCDMGMAGLSRSRYCFCSAVDRGEFGRNRVRSVEWLRRECKNRGKGKKSRKCGLLLRSRKSEPLHAETNKAEAAPLLQIRCLRQGLMQGYGKLEPARGALSGLRVLDLSHGMAAPLATRLLAEHGAEVLQVRTEDMPGVPDSLLELDGWAGKRWVRLRGEEKSRKLKSLIREADLLVTGSAWDLEDFGIREEELKSLNPHLILANLRNKPAAGAQKPEEELQSAYLAGLFLLVGALKALQLQLVSGGSYQVEVSHEAISSWLQAQTAETKGQAIEATTEILENQKLEVWKKFYYKVAWNAVGDVFFPAPVAWSRSQGSLFRNMRFTDNCSGFEER